MKPPPFTYHAPDTVEDALATLQEVGDGGKVLAGGQSLIPLLNMRLAAPAHLVDITRIDALRDIDVGEAVTVDAGVRHATLERDDAAADACPLLRQSLRHVAHPVIRNRGTVCGSIAHADPAGELTAVLALLGGTVRVARHGDNPRDVPADEFFLAPLESALEPGDLVTAVRFPAMPPDAGSAFVELARRHGDYALCGIGAVVELDDDGGVATARVGAISIHPTPLVVDCTEVLVGDRLTDDALREAGELVADRSEPEPDLHATVVYRRRLTQVLVGRALAAAADHARQRSGRQEEAAGG